MQISTSCTSLNSIPVLGCGATQSESQLGKCRPQEESRSPLQMVWDQVSTIHSLAILLHCWLPEENGRICVRFPSPSYLETRAKKGSPTGCVSFPSSNSSPAQRSYKLYQHLAFLPDQPWCIQSSHSESDRFRHSGRTLVPWRGTNGRLNNQLKTNTAN